MIKIVIFEFNMLNKKLKGAWLIHHAKKLSSVDGSVNSFENTLLAGKAGTLLSSLSNDNQDTISKDRLQVLTSVTGINKLERDSLLKLLKDKELIDYSSSGEVVTLGLTNHSVLEHTANIFESEEPSNVEQSALVLSEKASNEPVLQHEIEEFLADNFKLSKTDSSHLFFSAEKIGFTDVETISSNEKILFNGNLFKREFTKKIGKIFQTLSTTESQNISELNEILQRDGCVQYNEAEKILGTVLLNKLGPIGFYDISLVSNSTETIAYLTLPSAFSKFGSNPIIDDTFDLAKAFISSLKYGMTRSSSNRGKIQMIELLLKKLISGKPVGPVTAIGQDYKVLEFRGVVRVEPTTQGMFYLHLLKKEVGEIALQVLTTGGVSEQLITNSLIPSTSATTFKGPEFTREISRKKQLEQSPNETNQMINILRTGGL